MRKIRALAAVTAALPSCLLSPAITAADAAEELNEIVVTATRTMQPRRLTGESVSVLTASELAAQQVVGLDGALQSVPGVVVVRNGGPGQPTAIGLRGALAGQTVLLVDGVRLNDPGSTDGAVILADVLADRLDRVEVLRGPQSTLYGSDAIGGVVNLMTARGGASSLAPSALLEVGSLGSWHATAGARGTAGSLDYGVTAGALHTNGVSAADARDGNSERDGFRHEGATVNLRWHASDALSLDARGYYTDSRVDYDGYPPPDYRFQDTADHGRNQLLAGYVGANLTLLDGRLEQRVALMRTSSDRRLVDPTQQVAASFIGMGRAERVEYQGSLDISAATQLVFGAESQRSTLRTLSPSDWDPRPVPTQGASRITGYFLQAQTTLVDAVTLTGGLRRDENSGFGSHDSLKLSAAWQIASTGTVLHANYGDGFKAPSLYELYSEYSNPSRALSPESARGWEAGIDQNLPRALGQIGITAFERRTRDQIDFFDCYGLNTAACVQRRYGYYENLARSRSRGIEAEARIRLPATLVLGLNATWLDAKDESSGSDLPRRPRRTANLRLDAHPREGIELGADWHYIGPRLDNAWATTPMPGYALVDLQGSWRLSASVTLLARIGNALDRRYSPVAGYGALPRTGTLGLRWVPAR